MQLHLARKPSYKDATLGALAINGIFFCWILEDVVRETKVPGKTAIPAGTYLIDLTWSPRFKRVLPVLLGVRGFDGVRIHPGSTSADTEGCLLPGYQRHENWVNQSRAAFNDLFARLEKAKAAGETISITIENPAGLQ